MIFSLRRLLPNRQNALVLARLSVAVASVRPLSPEIQPSQSFIERTYEGLLQLFDQTSTMELRTQSSQSEEEEGGERIVA